MEFLDRVLYKSPLSNFTDVLPVKAALIQTERWTDMTLFANVKPSKNYSSKCSNIQATIGS